MAQDEAPQKGTGPEKADATESTTPAEKPKAPASKSSPGRTAAAKTAPARTAVTRKPGGPRGFGGSGNGGSGNGGPGGNGNGHRPGFSGNPWDQTFPIFTVEGSTLKPTLPDDQTPNVTAVLRDLLGWRPVPGDAKAFSAALEASFKLTQVEGHVESQYVPRGFSMQADLGSVTGGQASLYARARAGLEHILQLLAGLTPLQPAFDQENNEATRALIRNEITRIVEELGQPGGPRQVLVDASFAVLLGTDEDVLTNPKLPDLVEGQLGELRDRFGLTAENVNTVEDERIRTSFWTLADEIQDLGRAWHTFTTIQTGTSVGFLGTDFVLISRLMEAASEQVDEFEEVLDSVLVGAAERQTITLDDTGLTLDGLLEWTRRFLREDGRSYLTDSGRIGLQKAFEPTAARLVDTYRRTLVVPLELEDDDVLLTTASPADNLPDGLSAARCKLALLSLFRQLDEIHEIAARVTTGLVVGDVTLTHRPSPSDASSLHTLDVALRLDVPASATPPALALALRSPLNADKVVLAADDTDQVGDRLTATFRFDASRNKQLAALPVREPVRVSADRIPLVVVDVDTGRSVFDSRTKSWDDADLSAVPAPTRRRWSWQSDEDTL